MSAPDYDVIVVGSGAAGLNLAYHLQQSPLRTCSLLLVDPHAHAADYPERTWCFWAARPTPFDAIVARSWSQMQLVGADGPIPLHLGVYRYQMIRGSDFIPFVHAALSSRAERLHGHVDRIDDGAEHASVVVGSRRITGTWVFDSRFTRSARTPDGQCYRRLWQRFTGWEIETTDAAFIPQVATFMDFRASQHAAVRFFSVLPLSTHRALVDSVAINRRPLEPDARTVSVGAYLDSTLGIRAYRVTRIERGASLLTDQPFPRRIGRHVMTIGRPGGRLKPSTGYAFARIQEDAAAIVRSLSMAGHPFAVPPSPRRYRFFDAVMLRIMAEHPDWVAPLLTALCTRQPLVRLWRFLDEEAPPWDNLRMLPALPPRLLAETVKAAGGLRHVRRLSDKI